MRILRTLLCAAVSASLLVQPVLAESFFYRHVSGGGSGVSAPGGGAPPPAQGENTVAPTTQQAMTAQVGAAFSALLAGLPGLPISGWVQQTGTLPDGIGFDGETGAFSGVPGAAQSDVSLGFRAIGSDGSTLQFVVVSLNVLPDGLASGSVAYDARAGRAFSAVLPAPGGVSVTSWRIASPLPAGLALTAATGAVSGTPVAATVASTRFEGLNAAAQVVADVVATFTIAPGPSIAAIPNRIVQPNTFISIVPIAADTIGSVNWAAVPSELPGGLSFNPFTGAIEGIVTTWETSASLRLRVTDSENVSALSNIFVVGTPASPTSISNISNATIALDRPYSASYSAAGMTGTPTWSVSSGSLPQGLALDPQTGTISGIPESVGNRTGIVLRVETTSGESVNSNSFSINVVAPHTVSFASMHETRVGRSFSVTPTASPTGTYTWTVEGTLPPGIAVTSNSGRLSGTPTAIGFYGNLRLRAQASNGIASFSEAFSIVVSDGVGISYSWPQMRVSREFTAAPSITGNTGTPGFSMTGTLPQGVSFDAATGTVSGAPTRSRESTGYYGNPIYASATLRVTDSDGTTRTVAKTFNDIGEAVSATYPRTVAWSPDTALSITPTVANAIGARSFAVESGALGPFALNPTTGAITGSSPATGIFTARIRVSDADGTSSVSAEIRISVTNEPDVFIAETPAAKAGREYLLQPVYDNISGTAVYTSTGTVPPGMSYSTSLGRLSGRPTTPGSYPFSFNVRDSRNITVSAETTIVVEPGLALTAQHPAKWRVGLPGTLTLAAGNAVGDVSWSLISGTLPAGLTLSASAGTVSGTPTATTARTVTLRATDSEGTRADGATTFTIESAPALSYGGSKSLYPGEFATISPTVSGLQGAPVFAIASGTLPDGLTLNTATGVISGVPVTGPTRTLSIRVTDADGAVGAAPSFSIAVTTSDFVVTASGATGIVGDSFAMTPSAILRDEVLNQYVAWTLIGSPPPGLSFNVETGRLAGTPTQFGSYTLRFSAQYGLLTAVSDPVTVTVNDRPSLLASMEGPTTAVRRGVSMSLTPALQNAVGVVLWEVYSGALPTGLTLNQNTGVVAGAPSLNGSYSFVMQVRDATGRTSRTAPVQIVVQEAMTASATVVSSNNRVGKTFLANAATVGAVGQVTWSQIDGVMAPGLTLDPATGNVTGTPGQHGTWIVTLRARDGQNAIADTVLVYDIGFAPLVGNVVDQSLVAGEFFSMTPSATRTSGTTTWTLLPNQLPAGLSFNPGTGAISGTPAAASLSESLRLRVTDGDGLSGTSTSFVIRVIASGAPSASIAPTLNVNQDEFFAVTPVATGLSGTLSFSYDYYSTSWNLGLTTPGTHLPTGLQFDTATGRIHGTNTSGTVPRIAYRIRVTNGTTTVVSNQFVFVIKPRAQATVSVPPIYEFGQGEAGSFTPTLSGATGNVTFSYDYYSTSWQTGITAPLTHLPTGLQFDTTTGRIHGVNISGAVPRIAYRIRATETRPGGVTLDHVSNWFAISIKSQVPPTLSIDPVLSIAQGEPVTLTPTVSGASGSRTFSYDYYGTSWQTGITEPLTHLPTGLHFDTTTGRIHGSTNATIPPRTAYRIRMIENRGGVSHTVLSNWFAMQITPAVKPVVTVDETALMVRGQPFSLTPTVTDAKASVTFSFDYYSTSWQIDQTTAGTHLPAGLQFDPETGQISGVSSAAVSPRLWYRIRIKEDRNGILFNEVSRPFSFRIKDWEAPGIVYQSDNHGVLGQSMTIAPTLTNVSGTATYLLQRFSSTTAWTTATAANLPAGLVFDAATGVISGTPTTTTVTYPQLRVLMTETRGSPAVSIPVHSPPFQLGLSASERTRVLAFDGLTGVVTKPVTLQPVLTGDTASSFTIAYQQFGSSDTTNRLYRNATLPTGLGFNSATGVISGTPTHTQHGSFTGYRVCAVTSTTPVCQDITIVLNDRVFPQVGYPAYPTFAVQEQVSIVPVLGGEVQGNVTYAISYRQFGTADDNANRVYNSTALPSGLNFDAGTGAIFGAVNINSFGTYRGYKVCATDANRTACSDEIVLRILDRAPLSVSVPPILEAEALKPMDPVQVGVANAREDGTVTYSITYPSPTFSDSIAREYRTTTLPGGIVFDTATGILSGTPGVNSYGTYNEYRFCASDGQRSACSDPVSIRVADRPPLAVSMPPVVDAAVLQAMTPVQVAVSSANPGSTVTYSITYPSPTFSDSVAREYRTNTLPGGVGFNTATGILSGTPTINAFGTYNEYKFCATDGQRSACSDLVSLRIADRPAVTIEAPNRIIAVRSGEAMSPQQFVVGNSVATPVFSITYPSPTFSDSVARQYRTNTLPTGIVFDTATGTLSGTPAASLANSTFNGYRFCVADSNKSACTDEISIVVE